MHIPDFDLTSIGKGKGRSLFEEIQVESSARLLGVGTGSMPQYQKDPLGFITKILNVPERRLRWSLNPGYKTHKWDGTPDPLIAILDALAGWQNVGCESGMGTGKTFLAACILLWFLASFENSNVITIAPKKDQLTQNLWKEVGKLWPYFKPHFPDAENLDLAVRMLGSAAKDKSLWSATGFGVGVGKAETAATRARGFHAEHMLFILEEMTGQHPAVVTAVDMTCSAPHNLQLAIGNPDHRLDPLHQFCERPSTVHVIISGLDHPNVVVGDASIVPGAFSKTALEKRKEDLGEDSRLYNAYVRGISPEQAADALIRLEWLRASHEAWEEEKAKLTPADEYAMGVDVADSDEGDKAAKALGKGAVLLELDKYPCPDSNAFGRQKIKPIMDHLGIDPGRVGVDGNGVGAGTINELKRLGVTVQNLIGGMRAVPNPDEAEQFLTLRSQMYWQLRKDLQHGRVFIPKDLQLWQELTEPTWEPRNKVIHVEPKESIKKRLKGRSPDKADAVVYWNWVRQFRGLASVGGADQSVQI